VPGCGAYSTYYGIRISGAWCRFAWPSLLAIATYLQRLKNEEWSNTAIWHPESWYSSIISTKAVLSIEPRPYHGSTGIRRRVVPPLDKYGAVPVWVVYGTMQTPRRPIEADAVGSGVPVPFCKKQRFCPVIGRRRSKLIRTCRKKAALSCLES
jgi:hypothetical protein